LLICFSLTAKAQADINQLIIEELEFPDTVVLGDVHMLTGLIKNEGNEPVDFDFDLGIDFDEVLPGFNFEYIFDDFIPCIDFFWGGSCDLQPGESRSFSKPVYISNERVAPNQQNVVITWPVEAIGDNPDRGQPRSRSFYVQENTSKNAEINDCSTVLIEQLEDVINISGLYSAEVNNISVVNQFHEVIYFCNNDCPSGEVLIDISDGGYYLVQVNLVNGFDYCYETEMIFTENWLNYQNYIMDNNFPSYNVLESIFELPNLIYDNTTGFIYGTIEFIDNLLGNISLIGNIFSNGAENDLESPNLLRVPNQYLGFGCGIEVVVENDEFKFIKPTEGIASIQIKDLLGNTIFECDGAACTGNEIIVQLPELDEMKYTVDVSYTNNNQVCNNTISMDGEFMFDEWNNLFDICSKPNILHAPVIDNVFQQSASVYIPGFFTEGSIQIKKEDETEWQIINKSYATYLLSQLDACTTYEVRAAYKCNNTDVFSAIQTFTTKGCVECTVDDIDMQIMNVYGNITIISWDIFSEGSYLLHYKKQEDADWQFFETPIPFVVLFNLQKCTSYQFYLEVKCTDGNISTPGKVVDLETGACRYENKTEASIKIHPNIADQFVHINTSDIDGVNELRLYNQAGALVQLIDQSKIRHSGTYKLDISALPKGVYVISTNTNNKIYHNKFIKQ